jgi:hypothetical protein
MWDRTTLDQEGNFRGIELRLGVVFWVPVHFHGWQMLDGIVVCILRIAFHSLLVGGEDVCDCPTVDAISSEARLRLKVR